MKKALFIGLLVIGVLAFGIGYLRMSAATVATPTPEKPAALFDQSAAPDAPPDVRTALQFVDGADKCGLLFANEPSRSSEKYMPEVMGSGVVIADFNRDGAPDVVLINAGDLRTPDRTHRAANRIYFNDGRGNFSDRTKEWNLPSPGYGMGGAAGDFDNDGWTDLFLTSWDGVDALLRNTGKGFVNVTADSGIPHDGRWSTSAGFFDMDGDGDLDLYITRYVNYTLENALKCYYNRIHIYCTPVLYDAVPDRLLRNNGDGTFTDVSVEAGIPQDACKGLAVAIGDVDSDGDVDIYVANDTSRNFLLINDGLGKFEEIGRQAGVAYSETGAEEAGMGVDLSDVNADRRMDIVCSNFQGETTSIYRQGERLFFREVSDTIGVGRTARARLSFGLDFFDADNDGDEDLLVGNGHIEDNVHSYRQDVTFEQANTLYECVGLNKFVDVTAAAGPALSDRQVSRGLATADLDNDGDLDFIINNNGGTAQVGMNETKPIGNFVSLWLEGRKSNRNAIGARVVAKIGDREITRQVQGASSYLSICDFRVHLGLAGAESIDELTIYWPSAATQVVRNLAAGRFYRIVEGEEPMPYRPGERTFEP